jgi:hypothetical protein
MSIKLKGSTAGSVALDAPANTSPSGSDIALTLPINAGSANQYLKNGSTAGALEFGDLPTVGFTSSATQNTTTGSAYTVTGLSTSANLHVVSFSGISTNATTPHVLFQLGNGSLSTSGYSWNVFYEASDQNANSQSTVRLTHTAFSSAVNEYSGILHIACGTGDSVTGTWNITTKGSSGMVGAFRWTGGTSIDRFSLQASGSFDSGSFKIHSR